LCVLLLAPLSLRTPLAQTAAVAPAGANANARVIVKYKADSVLLRKTTQSAGTEAASAQLASRAQALGQRLGIGLSAGAGITERSHVVFASGIGSEDLAQRIAAQSDIEYAVPDVRRHRYAVPSDPFYASRAATSFSGGPLVGQWYLKPAAAPTTAPTSLTANTAPAAIDAQTAWDITIGSSSTVVAVLDTGVRFDHADFKTVADGGNLLSGYDMVSEDAPGVFVTAGDGDGRDADASDPGDFVTAGDVGHGCTSDDIGASSSWHGTETIGLIGAVTDNSAGIASVGRNVLVLPVRVLGKCGGNDSDIIAAMLWAAGLSVPGVPLNTHKARVINLSLGGVGACSQAYVDAVAQVNAQGTVVVASAGNSAGHAVSTPANCPGVIGVAGLRYVGTKVGFSDIGTEISISAPGGNCINITSGSSCLYPIMTTSNSGKTTPKSNAAGGSVYTDSFKMPSIGTSFSAPLVSGTVALMLSVQPGLTPVQAKSILQSSANPFPTTGGTASAVIATASPAANLPVVINASESSQCLAPSTVDQLECYCTTTTCGAGMLNAHAAVSAAAGIPLAPSIPDVRHTVAYQWSLLDGGGIVTTLADTSSPSISVTPTGAGTFTVGLATTDDLGAVSTSTTTVAVAATAAVPPPASAPSGGGGGGALDFGWLLLLGCAVVALRIAPAGVRR
ncbi:MAG: S8 family peptidase, partial [Caldimonas sp.]